MESFYLTDSNSFTVMGIFDSDKSEEEVQINPSNEESSTGSKLKSEVESKVVPGSDDGNDSTVSSVASGSKVSNKDSNRDISVEDVYRQNERIIELLEKLTDSDDRSKTEDNNENFDGDLNGVL